MIRLFIVCVIGSFGLLLSQNKDTQDFGYVLMSATSLVIINPKTQAK